MAPVQLHILFRCTCKAAPVLLVLAHERRTDLGGFHGTDDLALALVPWYPWYETLCIVVWLVGQQHEVPFERKYSTRHKGGKECGKRRSVANAGV